VRNLLREAEMLYVDLSADIRLGRFADFGHARLQSGSCTSPLCQTCCLDPGDSSKFRVVIL
jgi:hypothetical protein